MATVVTKKPDRDQLKSDQVLCEFCIAKCCRYFALPMEEPSSWADFEFIRWYLLHGQASVFTDDGSWYLMVHTDCKHLMPDNRCDIYETRPQICRDYTTDNCEYEDDWVYDRYFETPEQVEEYAEATLGPMSGTSIRSRRPSLLPIMA